MRHTSKFVLSAVVASTVASLFPTAARAVDYTWNQTAAGTYAWDNAANWTSSGGTFPNAAGDTANLSVALAGNVTVDVGATNGTAAVLTLGGTAGAVTTNVTSSGAGML